MPKYVIERDIRRLGTSHPNRSSPSHKNPAASSRTLVRKFSGCTATSPQDKIYCVYIAPNEEMVREHAKTRRLPGQSGL